MSSKNKLLSPPPSLAIKYSDDEPLLTKQEIADFLRVSVKMIDKQVSMNQIPFFKVGKLVRFSKQRVIESIERGSKAG